tara:strand:- start:318 stop:467 length:150 start_codon:yes stop_codon:yes gene_type:complete
MTNLNQLGVMMIATFGLVVGAKFLGVSFNVNGISKSIQDGIGNIAGPKQ